ncbi:MAG: 5-(carboxyamino)imidazole ribonucleotide mutase [Candidatus Levybacteria bacterium RIFCSPLOWO2_01_FULL_39_24]|nr:MAG: 5-(carboxyamino)imidazole ribonucleotide mutase [Candidatus Levybacteria bacterium RIFCSPHIGHO2_01_FULL_40_16]OGH27975.1 MAG: 5-(carboxyamino)imidazole ribonucleotide mutase [Candidatus Levybacteria bacterium RIFCSPHIGHO2_12_FULL_39_9]OGH46783.1 MAG: 5-(carboxyamino)imidazole ribonucleotide mutase [Candidatus Levybacteria bacterium RIFCSPLOWO2_01_FULL_39_24]
MKKILVGILLGSDSDLPVMSKACEVLEEFKVPYKITVSSAHRSPELTVKNIENFKKIGVKVIIAGAGLAAHLAGVVAAHFPLPVIGVPLRGGALNGIDSLYSTVQMPPGIPVATVGIDNAKNAGLLAIQILATSNKLLEKKLLEYKKELALGVLKKAEKLEKVGWKKYS